MAINTHGSNIRVETNVNGIIKDNDEWTQERSVLEHQRLDNQPWSQGYIHPEEVKEKVRQLYEEHKVIKEDPKLTQANIQDLKIKNLHQQ